jgi:hypothetical protein
MNIFTIHEQCQFCEARDWDPVKTFTIAMVEMYEYANNNVLELPPS